MSRKKWLTFVTVLLIANLAFIWGNSALPGQESSRLSEGLLKWIGFLLAPFGDSAMLVLRKAAHMTEFASLGLLLKVHFSLRKKNEITAPMFLGLFAACVDETIQIFSPGRASGLTDVWIDFGGLTLGITLALLGQYYLKKRNYLEDKT